MRKLGLIGGTSWHSTIEYYSFINQAINDYFKNNTNPPLLVYTLNQAEIHRLQKEDKWSTIAEIFVDAAMNLNKGGAEAILICANTPHKVFDLIQNKLNFPILHIADATGNSIRGTGINRIGFIGTKFTMEEGFIIDRIRENGIEVFVPEKKSQIIELHRIIQKELSYGRIVKKSKDYVMHVIGDLLKKGAEGIVLGCTEFPLMISNEDLKVPLFNTTEIHAKAAVEFILDHK